jgi:hypothetical protein
MKNYYDDFDGFNNKRHREVVSKNNEYEDEYELDALHIVADDILDKKQNIEGDDKEHYEDDDLYQDEDEDDLHQDEDEEESKPTTVFFKQKK